MDENVNILVVDDNPNLRKTLSAILKAKGYVSLTAATGKTAVDIAREQMPVVALIDLKLEDISGLEVIRMIKECSPGTECIVLTGHASQESAIEAMNLGAYSYVQKPYDIEQLLLTVRRAIEKRETEEALRESEERSRIVADFAYDWEYWTDPDGNYVYVSPSCERISGYRPDEFKGEPGLLEAITHPDDRAVLARHVDEASESSEACSIDFRIISRSGEERWIAHVCQPVYGTDGSLLGRRASNRDITQRKRAETALKSSNEDFQQVVSHITCVLWKADIGNNGAFENTYTSPVVDELLELPAGTLQNDWERYFSYIKPEYLKQVNDAFREAIISPGKKIDCEYEVLKDNGQTAWFHSKGRCFEKDGKLHVFGSTIDITERKQAEDKIKAKSHFLESLIQQSPLPTFVMDSKGFTVMVNDAFLKLYAVPNKEMILGKNALTEPANVSQGVIKYFKEALTGKIVEIPEIGFVSPYENRKYITRCRMFPIVDPTGTLSNVVVVQEDITERKQAEEALKESETQYRNLYSMMRLMSDNLPDLIWTKDMEGKYLFVNKACSEILLDAKDTDEPIGKTDIYFSDRMMKSYPEIPDYLTFGKKCAESDLTVLKTNKPMRFDESGNVKGKFLFLDVYKAPFHDENGNAMGTVGSARIVTKERQIKKALRESEERLAGIVSSVTYHISMMDEHHNIVWANDVGKQMFGPDLIGKRCYAVYHGRDQVCDPCGVSESFADGKSHEYETEVIGVDGKRMNFWCTANVAAWYGDGRPKLVVEVSRDITERKKLEAQLIQAQKMGAIGRLAGGVAHDFNNLLTVIRGYSQMMLRKLKPDDPNYEDLLEIKKAGDRASGLTEQLLAFSRKQVIQPRILDLNAIVADTEKMLRRMIGEDIDLVTLLDPDLGNMRMDPGQIQQILMNLAVNARDAMPQGGTLTLETSGINVGESYILEDVEVEKGPYVVLTVSDTGVGMDKETMSYVFEPFFSTKEKGKGTGLGLSTVYGIVKQNDGYIWLSSELGKGTTVRIYLPRVLETTGVSEPDQTDLESARGAGTILLVEDDESVRRFAKRILSKSGYFVLEAAEGDEALRLSEQHAERIDLMVTDVVMPGKSGKQLAEEIESKRPGMKVIYISGYTDDAVAHHGVLESGIVLVQKPFAPEVLLKRIREVLASPDRAR